MATTLPIEVNAAIVQATDRFFQENKIDLEQSDCKAGILQGLSVDVAAGSTLSALGNIEATQRARVQFQCVPNLNAVQRQQLTNAIALAVGKILTGNLPADTKRPSIDQLKQIVALTIDQRFDKCARAARRNVAVAPGVRFVGSDLRASACTDDEFAALADGCRQEIAQSIFNGAQCKAMNECVRGDEKIVLLQTEIDFDESSCPQLSSIAANVFEALRRLNASQSGTISPPDKPPNSGAPEVSANNGLSTPWIIALAVGGALLLVLLVSVIVILLRTASGRQQWPRPSGTDPALYLAP